MIYIFALAGKIQLVPDGTLVFHVLLILIMVAILNATLFKPINRILAERDSVTRGRMTEAQKIFASVREKLEAYEAQLRNARAEGYALAEQTRAISMKDHDQQLVSAREELKTWVASEKKKLAQETERAQRELGVESQILSKQIASRIMGRQVSAG